MAPKQSILPHQPDARLIEAAPIAARRSFLRAPSQPASRDARLARDSATGFDQVETRSAVVMSP